MINRYRLTFHNKKKMTDKELKIYALLIDNISRQLLFMLSEAKKRKIIVEIKGEKESGFQIRV